MRKSKFVGSSPVVEENAAGIIVTKAGQTYNVAVEVDDDTVVQVDSTSKDKLDNSIEELLPQVDEYRDRFKNCFRD